MVEVRGRVLQSPTVIYGGKSGVPKINQKSRWNMIGRTVFSSRRLENWGILRIVRGPHDVQREQETFTSACNQFVNTLKSTLGNDNVALATKVHPITVPRGNEDALTEGFVTCLEEGRQLLLIVLPDNDASTYKQIKKLGDVDHGISTVCVLGEKNKFYMDWGAQYFANVALKINLKLGGINHPLRNQISLYETTMVIGIDVTHPSPGSTKKTAPSVAAMVASVDNAVLPSLFLFVLIGRHH